MHVAANGCLPVSNSHNVTPNAYTSLSSDAPPPNTSGAIDARVPTTGAVFVLSRRQRQAEVRHLRVPAVTNRNVAGFQSSVHQTLLRDMLLAEQFRRSESVTDTRAGREPSFAQAGARTFTVKVPYRRARESAAP